MLRVFNIIMILAFAFLGCVLCDDKNLAYKLQRIVNHLNKIIIKLTPNKSATEISSPIAAGDWCKPGDKCPRLPVCSEQEINFYLAIFGSEGVKKNMKYSKKHKACGKIYDFQLSEYSVEEAHVNCCKCNMTLLSVDSVSELNCIRNVYKMDAERPKMFWTSGRLDKSCSANYSWCSLSANSDVGQAVPWKDGFPNSTMGNCIAIDMTDLNKVALVNVKCTARLRFFCESHE